MTHFEQPSWKRPEPKAPAATDAAAHDSPSAVSVLLGTGSGGSGDSRRVAFGLAVLALLSVVLLNFGILQSARENLAEQRWSELADHIDTKREELRDLLWQFEREVTFVAQQETVRRQSWKAASAGLTPAERTGFELELERACSAFHLHAIHLVSADGEPMASSERTAHGDPSHDRELAIRAALSGKVTLGVTSGTGEEALVTLAFPVTGSGERPPVLLFHNSVEEVLLPLLMSWPGFGSTAGAYLVQRSGDELMLVTSPPASLGLSSGKPLPTGAPISRAAEVAIEGVESRLESVDAHGHALWTVTRYLPEYGWGLVGQVSRDAMLAALRGTILGLLALDLTMVALAVAGFWLWRKQYRRGLARREAMVTQRHNQRVQSILDTAFDAILTFDRNGHVLGVNHAAERLFGRPGADLEGQPLQRFLHPLGAQGAGAFVLPTPGTMTRCEALSADGAVMPIELSVGTSGEGDDLLYTAIVRDISERVEAEQRIAAFADGLEISNRRLEEVNAQLEEASRLKSEFLANTSHELRTPLNGMIGFLQLVLDGLCDSKEEEREFQRQALQCSRHLLGLINDVLDIAKIEAGKLSVEMEAVDVPALFDEVYTVTHVQAAQKGVQLRFEPPTPCPHFVRADFNKVKQVLINLVGNSLKFTPRGRITVRATAHPELGHFMFEVVDTGIGIDPARQKLIFEKFIQGDGSTTRKYGGTGLGLAISRSLVELMGGIIGVHSDGEGHGTRMYFSLPVWREGGAALDAPVEDAPGDRIEGPATGALVLVVEDDSTFRKYLTSLLHAHGFRTVEARHAEGGWLLARRLRPAVVVLDYAMGCPEGASLRTGWDLAERMTSDSKTRHIPVVFVTGFDSELKEKLKTTAFARHPDHLMKPIDGNALLRKIEELAGTVEGRTVRVLMADDDPSVGAFIRKVLPEHRFHLEVANNGEECLHILRTQPRGFDVLLLDLMMPQVSGYDVLRELTLTGLGTDLPVLVLTNFPEGRNDEEKRLLEQGLVLDVLAKSSVHDNPQLLAHVIAWHLQVVAEGDGAASADQVADAFGAAPAVKAFNAGAPDAPDADGAEREAA